jgi:hypothetical protein
MKLLESVVVMLWKWEAGSTKNCIAIPRTRLDSSFLIPSELQEEDDEGWECCLEYFQDGLVYDYDETQVHRYFPDPLFEPGDDDGDDDDEDDSGEEAMR